ncbi:MAG: TRAP transporter small permease subunit [Desulfobacterales bacterium]
MQNPLLEIIDRISLFAATIGAFFIAAAIIMLIPEVISRYIFNHSFLFVHDIAIWLCGAMYLLGGAYTLQKNGHVNVDIIYSRFRPRTQALLNLIAYPLFCAFCGVLAWEGSKLFWDSFQVFEKTVTPWGGPVWLFKLTLPLGACLILLQGFAKFVRDIRVAFGKEI